MYPKLHLSVHFQRTQPAVLLNSSLLDSKVRPNMKEYVSIYTQGCGLYGSVPPLTKSCASFKTFLRFYFEHKLFLTVQPPASPF